MKRLIFLALACLAAFNCTAAVVNGRVTADGGEPVAGAVVSDGVKAVVTDSDGSYSIKTNFKYGYVFLSVPSGYEVPAKGLIPQFFKYVDKKNTTADFELKKVDQSRFRLVVFNDIHLTNDQTTHDIDQVRSGFSADAAAYLPTLGDLPLYAQTLGDMTTDSRWYKQHFALPEYLDEMASFPVPVFHAMGNHDNDMRAGGGDFNSSSTFRAKIGPNFYSYNLGVFHILVLDNIIYDNPLNDKGYVAKVTEYHKYVDRDQLAWLKNDLALVPEDTPLIICCHAPFHRITGIKNGALEFRDDFDETHPQDEVFYYLKNFKRIYILSGHTHENFYVKPSEGILEHNHISVSGSSWKTDGLFGMNMSRDGVPVGYTVYEFDGGNVSWYYKPIGMDVDDCQFRAYDMNTVPAQIGVKDGRENVIWLNVFNYDPSWTVEVSENGTALTVERKYLKDPLYSAGILGSPLMDSGAFKPHGNSHMFEVQAATADAPVKITVSDGFGRSWSQTLVRPKAFGFDMPLGNE